jgi:hypothetical protein
LSSFRCPVYPAQNSSLEKNSDSQFRSFNSRKERLWPSAMLFGRTTESAPHPSTMCAAVTRPADPASNLSRSRFHLQALMAVLRSRTPRAIQRKERKLIQPDIAQNGLCAEWSGQSAFFAFGSLPIGRTTFRFLNSKRAAERCRMRWRNTINQPINQSIATQSTESAT